jgi:hypothetical protein
VSCRFHLLQLHSLNITATSRRSSLVHPTILFCQFNSPFFTLLHITHSCSFQAVHSLSLPHNNIPQQVHSLLAAPSQVHSLLIHSLQHPQLPLARFTHCSFTLYNTHSCFLPVLLTHMHSPLIPQLSLAMFSETHSSTTTFHIPCFHLH